MFHRSSVQNNFRAVKAGMTLLLLCLSAQHARALPVSMRSLLTEEPCTVVSAITVPSPSGSTDGDETTVPEGSTVTLLGSGDGSDSYAYSWVINGGVVSSGDSQATYVHTATDEGSTYISLTVTGSRGCMDSSTHIVTGTNAKPVISGSLKVSPDSPLKGEQVTLSFDFSDAGLDDTHTATCAIAGTDIEFTATVTGSKVTAVSTTASAAMEGGEHKAECTVQDNAFEDSLPISIDFQVCDVQSIITGLVGTSAAQGSTITLRGETSTTFGCGGSIDKYVWKIDDKAASVSEESEYEFTAAADIEVSLTVTNTAGREVTSQLSIEVTNVAPVATDIQISRLGNVDPSTGLLEIGLDFKFTDAGIDDTHEASCIFNGKTVTGVVTEPTTVGSNGLGSVTASGTFSGGDYTVRCFVSDDKGGTSDPIETATFTVCDKNSVPGYLSAPAETSMESEITLFFSANLVNGAADLNTYSWKIGSVEVSTSSDFVLGKDYTDSAGQVIISLTVTNAKGCKASFVHTVDVFNVAPGPPRVDLGTAANFAVLAGATVTNDGATVIKRGHLGLSPGTSVTGFPPGLLEDGAQMYKAVAIAATAKLDLTAAYTAAAALTQWTNKLDEPMSSISMIGELGGSILPPALYKSTSGMAVTGTLVLDGQNNPDSVWIFSMASTFVSAVGSKIELINQAKASNVFWQVGSSGTLGTSSVFVGTMMAYASITAGTGAEVQGRLLTQVAAVTLLGNAITLP